MGHRLFCSEASSDYFHILGGVAIDEPDAGQKSTRGVDALGAFVTDLKVICLCALCGVNGDMPSVDGIAQGLLDVHVFKDTANEFVSATYLVLCWDS